MKNSRIAHERAERHFHPQIERDEKGSAMRTITADTLETQAKSARLRALRMARDAAIVVPAKKRAAIKTRRAT